MNVNQEAIEETMGRIGPFWTEQEKTSLSALLELSMLTRPAREHLMRVAGNLFDQVLDYGHTVEVFGELLLIPVTTESFMERFCDPANIKRTEKEYLGGAIAEALRLKRGGEFPTEEAERLQRWIATFQTAHSDNTFEGKI